jgi:hypothetical protein
MQEGGTFLLLISSSLLYPSLFQTTLLFTCCSLYSISRSCHSSFSSHRVLFHSTDSQYRWKLSASAGSDRATTSERRLEMRDIGHSLKLYTLSHLNLCTIPHYLPPSNAIVDSTLPVMSRDLPVQVTSSSSSSLHHPITPCLLYDTAPGGHWRLFRVQELSLKLLALG